jgi:NADP-dependent 3-hydroxy acid dehydrogenase YdfG
MAKAPRSLAGQVVAITGGGRGIGRATAAALIVQGARVAIGDIDAPLAERTAQELGGGTIGLPLDVTERASFEAFLRAVETRLGPLDVLINNAGIMPVGPFVEETDATARRLVDINLHGVIIGSKLALSRFLPRGRGHLVNIASTAGKAGFPGGATYCATKHAVVGLSEAIRAEVRGTEIGVSIVMPVGVNTELYSGLKSARGIKTAEPEDVANAIVEALQTGRVDVFVPRSVGRLLRLTSLVGRRVSDAVTRALKADQVLTNPNHAARAAYEQRLGDAAPPTGKSTTEQGSPASAGDDAIAAPGEAAPSEREKQVV